MIKCSPNIGGERHQGDRDCTENCKFACMCKEELGMKRNWKFPRWFKVPVPMDSKTGYIFTSKKTGKSFKYIRMRHHEEEKAFAKE